MISLTVLSHVALNKFDILAIILKKLENEGVWSLRRASVVNIWMKRTKKNSRDCKNFTKTKFLILLRALAKKKKKILWEIRGSDGCCCGGYCLQGRDVTNITVCRDVTSWNLSSGTWRREIYCLPGHDVMEFTVCMDVVAWRLCDAMELTVSWDVTP